MLDTVFHAAVLTAVLAAAMMGVCTLLCPWILHLLDVPEDIYDYAYQYLAIIFLGLPFTYLYNLLSSMLRSVGDSRTPFLFLAFSTVLNIGLDLFFILVLGWGCAGAAGATVTAQAVSGILCLIFIWKRVPVLHPEKENCRLRGASARNLAMMGIPMGLQFSVTAIGSMVMQTANNGLGSICVSGFAAAMRIKMFAICPFEAIATGISVFCGQNLGAGKVDRIRKGILDGLAISVGYGLFAGSILILFGRDLSSIFVSREATDVLDAAAMYLKCLGFFYWSLGILNVCRLAVQGLGYPGRAVFSGVMEMIARIAVSMLFVGSFGYTAICFTDQAAWIAACLYIAPMCWLCVKQVSALTSSVHRT